MTGLTSLTNSSISREAVAEYIEREIVSRRLLPGTRLPSERQLSERFEVSRPIVREALRTLVERNLIEVRPARGAYVRSADAADAATRLDDLFRRSAVTPRQLTEARQMLETTAAGLAAERATDIDRAQILQALERCEQAPNVLDQTRQDLAFHRAIVHASANPVIEAMFLSIASLTFQLMLRSLIDKDVVEESLPYHRAVFEAISNHDAPAASVAMQRHLDVARLMYGSDFDASLESIARREIAELLPGGLTRDGLLDRSDKDDHG
jgi:GntR family transcriptional repressor for pyruvate dehydrogenase complex